MLASNDVYLIAVLTAILSMIFAILMFILLRMQREKKELYNEKLKRIELENMREYFETKIYDYNKKLAGDNDRWNNVNHLIYDSQKYNYDNIEENGKTKPSLIPFIESAGININELNIKRNLVFVLTPFHKNQWETYLAIRNVCNNLSLDCQRGDEEHIVGDILPHVLKSMLEARIIIANISGRNPNVFYELGLAHALGKKTIIISEQGTELPFDLKSKRIILYNDLSELKNELTSSLAKALI